MPSDSTPASARAPKPRIPHASDSPRPLAPERVNLPGLNGRATRNLRHLGTVRDIRRGVALASVAFAATLCAGFGVPAYAQAVAMPPPVPAQTFVAAAALPVAAVSRDAYDVTVPPPLVWPVDPGTGIGSGFGPRASPCAGCSSVHEGVDFEAPYGSPIHAIAAGVVVETNNPGWAALGVHVAIEHVIDGQVVVSAYGHMQQGSMTLAVGDTVYPGQVVGLVGSTGESTGPHLHFEVRQGGTTPVDPLAWLHAHLG